MTQLKSLAHPDWPYAGTAHEWRGFVKDERKQIPAGIVDGECGVATRSGGSCETKTLLVSDLPVYQKQNFGPELP